MSTTIDIGTVLRVETRGDNKLAEVSVRLLNEQGQESAPILWVDNAFDGQPKVYLHLDGNADPEVLTVDTAATWRSTPGANAIT